MSPDISPARVWRRHNYMVELTDEKGRPCSTPGSGFLRGSPCSPEVCQQRKKTNSHPIPLAQAVHKATKATNKSSERQSQ